MDYKVIIFKLPILQIEISNIKEEEHVSPEVIILMSMPTGIDGE